jgi:hypothetical protein
VYENSAAKKKLDFDITEDDFFKITQTHKDPGR